MSKYTIELLKSSDIDAIVELEANVYGAHHWSKDSFYNELNNNLAHYYIVKNCTEKVIAYAGFWAIFEEAHITTLAVDSNFRRQNIAKMLLCKIIDKCYEEKIKFVTLEVRAGNVAAISLYEKFGFASVGFRKGYYQDNNEDALIMLTENIWYNKFKSNYNIIKGSLFKDLEVTNEQTYKTRVK